MSDYVINNADVFIWSLHLLGGAQEYLDVEDVYVKCHELAPKRFSWRTKDLPNYKVCAKALRDAEARRPSPFVKTGDGLKRRLSVEGQRWIEKNAPMLSKLLAPGTTVPEPRQRPDSRLLREIVRSELYSRWMAKGKIEAEKWEAAELLQCSPDSSVRIWRERVELFRNAAFAAERTDLLEFLDGLVTGNGRWFGQGEAK